MVKFQHRFSLCNSATEVGNPKITALETILGSYKFTDNLEVNMKRATEALFPLLAASFVHVLASPATFSEYIIHDIDLPGNMNKQIYFKVCELRDLYGLHNTTTGALKGSESWKLEEVFDILMEQSVISSCSVIILTDGIASSSAIHQVSIIVSLVEKVECAYAYYINN